MKIAIYWDKPHTHTTNKKTSSTSDSHLSMSEQSIPSPLKRPSSEGVDPARKLIPTQSASQVTALLLAKRPAHLLGLGWEE